MKPHLTKTKYQWVLTPHDDHELLHYVEAITDWDDNYWELYDSQFDPEDPHKFAEVMPWKSACGLQVLFSAPGLLSRMGSMRCNACCDTIGLSRGRGSAVNDEDCYLA